MAMPLIEAATPVLEPSVDVLVVDDAPGNLLALESALADVGCNVVTASSGAEALRRLLDRDFAVVVLDVHMPDMDGFETASLIRTRDRTRHLPIIFLSAIQKSDLDVVRGYSLGAVDFLFKPIVPEVLRAKVGVFVDLARKTEEVRRQAELLRAAELRDHERRLAEARQRWEAEKMRVEVERERRLAELMTQKASELARSVCEREEAEAALRRSHRRLEVLERVARKLLLESRPERLMAELYDEASAHLGLEVYLGYSFVAPDRLKLAFYGGVGQDEVRGFEEIRLGQGVSGRVAATRERVVVENTRELGVESGVAGALGLRAYVCHPLLVGERLFGTLAFGTRSERHFEPEELALLQTVVDQVAVANDRAGLITALEERNQQLARTDRRKSEFLAMLGHELRNPLAPILYALQLMQLGANPEVLARARGALERQVKHLVRIVDDLLDMSRIDNDKIELREEIVPIAQAIEDAVSQCRPLIGERRQRLEVELPELPLCVRGDATRLAQVVANLLNNSSRYTPAEGRIWVSCEGRDEKVIVRVADNGRGMPPQEIEQLFEPFVQSEAMVDRANGGLGLGLALVRKIVQLHGGEVHATSEGPDRGSEFVVSLPAVQEAQIGSGVQSVPPRVPGGRLRVLVVEDTPDVRDSLRDVLELVGHEVHTAASGPEGVELARDITPHVVLLDIGLPGLNGYEVAERICAAANGGQRPFLIALTGYGQPEDRSRALASGFNAHLVKPVDIEVLGRLLSSTFPPTSPALDGPRHEAS